MTPSSSKKAERERLPDVRLGKIHKFSISGHEGYICVGEYEDGRPGELFVKMSKQGSTMSGLMDTIGILTSISLQSGVPVATLAAKLEHMSFEPSEPGKADSVIDYIFRWLGREYGDTDLSVPVDS